MLKRKRSISRSINKNFIPYRKGGKWGYCDIYGKVVIQPNFSQVDFFDGSFAIVCRYVKVDFDYFEERYGLIDEKGNEVIPTMFFEITRSSFDGFIAKCFSPENETQTNLKCFDSNGIEFPIFPDLKSTEHDLVKGFAEKYEKIFRFSEHLFIAIAKDNERHSKLQLEILNHSGQHIQLTQVGQKIEKSILLQMGFWLNRQNWSSLNGKYGLFNGDGYLTIPYIYDSLSYFKNGLAIARLGKKYGIINLSNKIVVDFEYEKLTSTETGNTIYKGKIDENYHLFTIENEIVTYLGTTYTETDIDLIKGGSIIETYDEDDKITLKNNKGDTIFSIDYSFENIPLIHGDIAELSVDGKRVFIDHNGNKIFSKEYDIVYYLGLDRFYFEIFKTNSAGIIDSKEKELYTVDRLFFDRKWVSGELYTYNVEVMDILPNNQLSLIEISVKVYPTKTDYIIGYITKDGKECWEGGFNYRLLYREFQEDDEDFYSLRSESSNPDEYVEGRFCPACGSREYMCCNYWMERNS